MFGNVSWSKTLLPDFWPEPGVWSVIYPIPIYLHQWLCFPAHFKMLVLTFEGLKCPGARTAFSQLHVLHALCSTSEGPFSVSLPVEVPWMATPDWGFLVTCYRMPFPKRPAWLDLWLSFEEWLEHEFLEERLGWLCLIVGCHCYLCSVTFLEAGSSCYYSSPLT